MSSKPINLSDVRGKIINLPIVAWMTTDGERGRMIFKNSSLSEGTVVYKQHIVAKIRGFVSNIYSAGLCFLHAFSIRVCA